MAPSSSIIQKVNNSPGSVFKIAGTLPIYTIAAATTFNCILALLNANSFTLNSSAVIGFEAFIYVFAIWQSRDLRVSQKKLWIAISFVILFFGLINAIGSQAIDPKILRDALVIPIFVVLGLTSQRSDVVKVVLLLQIVVLAIMLFEAIRPEEFGRVFNIASYYINTRGFEEAQFWSQENSSLFVSATRPGERFLLNSLDIHRLSSVFLEPVSLGNYCVIVSMALIALWRYFSAWQRAFLVISEAMIIVGCDGRFASISILLMIALRIVVHVLPRYSNVLYFPFAIVMSFVLVNLLNLSPEGDDFPSRTAGSVQAISQMDWSAIVGFKTPHAYQVMDSGVAYLFYSQSVLGALILWSAISMGLPQRDRASAFFAHATGVYISLNLLVSYSMFSVKTAGLLWFIYGAIGLKNNDQEQHILAR